MENRGELIMELMNCDREMKQYFSEQAGLLLNDNFLNVLPGLINNSESARVIESHLNIMKSWS